MEFVYTRSALFRLNEGIDSLYLLGIIVMHIYLTEWYTISCTTPYWGHTSIGLCTPVADGANRHKSSA